MTLATLTAFWGVSALFIVTPGPDWAYAISAGPQRRALPAVLGLLAGHLLAALVVAAGVGALALSIPGALTVLTFGGAVYVVWVGVGMLRHPTAVALASDAAPALSRWRWWAKGFGVSGLNPKVLLLFLAVLPQFTDPADAWPLPAQILALGMLHLASCALVYFAVGAGSQLVLSSRPAAARIVSRVSGTALVAIGAYLLLSQLLL